MWIPLSVQHRLLLIIVIATLFIAAEITIGFRTHSLAVIADAFHYLGDLITFAVSYVVERYSSRKRALRDKPETSSTDSETLREEHRSNCIDTLTGFFNGSFLFALGLGILLQGVERFVQPEELNNPMLVMIMGCVGLGINVFFAVMLGDQHHGHGHRQSHGHDHESKSNGSNAHNHSWSIQSVLLHVLCDAMNNIALIVASTLVWKVPATKRPAGPENQRYVDPKNYADPACTMFIATIIMVLSIRLIRDTGKALLDLTSVGQA
ncbi:hypothetical protein KEM56_007302 [Ascosphaera pollenicola]|nr:hypothetical protein KEM56_007302 [Ascosphaera pollenicola]